MQKLVTKLVPTRHAIANEIMTKKNGGNNMGKVTIDIDQQTHLKLKLICTTKDVKIKDYVEEILTNQIVEDYKQLEIPTQ